MELTMPPRMFLLYPRGVLGAAPCARMLARMDVSEETKRRLPVHPCAELDLASLQQDILRCQEQPNEIAKRRQPLAIEKRGNYAYILDESTT